ncbi:KTSC domain-containing protein (plasmid) [Coraliomargarita sp. W4R53]
MNREQVSSSSIASVGYDDGSQTLEIEFLTGSIYQYFDVSRAEFETLRSSASSGKYFAANIKESYRFARV